MIMQDNPNESQNQDHEAKRTFKRILDAAKPYFTPVDPDYENHTVRGIIITEDVAHQAVLSFDAVKATLTVLVILRAKADLTMSRVMILLRLQNYTATGSSSIGFDPESSVIRVKSHGILPERSVVQPVVSAAMRDTLNVLENEDFKHFVN